MGVMVDSPFYLEDGDSTFLRIDGTYLPNYKAFHTQVGIATRFGPEGSGFEPRGGKRFYLLHTRPDRSRGPSSSSTMHTVTLCRGQSGRRVALTTHPHHTPRLRKE
jgi:hypothetical protein